MLTTGCTSITVIGVHQYLLTEFTEFTEAVNATTLTA